MKTLTPVLVLGLVMTTALAGCFGGAKQQTAAPPPPPPELSKQDIQRFEELAAPEIRNYSLPGSQALEPVTKWFNGSIDQTANTGIQDRNDRGGNDFNVNIVPFDISSLVPVGQPTALRIKLAYQASPGSSAKADIYACVPGYCSYYTTSNNDQFNWKDTVETMNVMTVGVSGQKAVVGVSEADGMVAGQSLAFSLEVQAQYFQDVLTPFEAYAFQVPPGATGITLHSVKPGQEHLQAKFIVLDPQDNLVSYNEYNDIAVTTESLFIPIKAPGEYVFYAQEMKNGFFSMVSDAPLDHPEMRILPVKEEFVTDLAGGTPAPGTPDKDFTGAGAAAPFSAGTEVGFTMDKAFPLEIWPAIKPGQAVSGLVEVKIIGPKGEVASLNRDLRVDNGPYGTATGGSLGLTRDESNTKVDWSKLAKGAYKVQIVADGETADIGHVVKTYTR